LTRAEPIAALYEQKRVHHVGIFAQLEDELCDYDGTGKSPNRLDALVWVLTELSEGAGGMSMSEIHQPQKYRPVMMGIMKEVI
jgi:phage terminase large subunit-like protein